MGMLKFFQCDDCGRVVLALGESPAHCGCGDAKSLQPNSVEAAQEKHIPVVQFDEEALTVSVGSVAHPMLEEHHIEWILIQTKEGGQYKLLHPSDVPAAEFCLKKDQVTDIYAYCNLHGLWKADLS